jgi:ornithine cyclodeaminase/alanine dehydrogenase-like protein (mu-crystallin family)
MIAQFDIPHTGTVVDLLRLRSEPCVYFDESQIHDILSQNTVLFMNKLSDAYWKISTGQYETLLPKKQIFCTSPLKGDLRVMSCVVQKKNDLPIKAVKIIGTNEENSIVQDKICVGKALLIHPQDNFVQAIFDVCVLSSFRTAAISVLAYKLLSGIKHQSCGIVGTGRIGYYTAYILHRWLRVKKIWVTDCSQKQRGRFRAMIDQFIPELEVTEATPEILYSQVKSVFLCTDSSRPLISGRDSLNLSFISSVGADADNLSELCDSVLGRKIFTDSRQSMMLGDMKRWVERGLLSDHDVTELSELVRKNTSAPARSLFISTGVALQDALFCHLIFHSCNQRMPKRTFRDSLSPDFFNPGNCIQKV